MATRQRDTPTVVLVEDDPPVRESLTAVIEASGLRVKSFASAKDFLAACDPQQASCLVLDVGLPGPSGIALHEELVRHDVCLPTIFLTGHAPPDVSDEARRRGVVAVFEKPCHPDQLIEAILSAIGKAGGSGS
jgi:FixJ family two-component response regulator